MSRYGGVEEFGAELLSVGAAAVENDPCFFVRLQWGYDERLWIC